jgi:hypothetical protein
LAIKESAEIVRTSSAHYPRHGKIANPSDISGLADSLAAHMKPPSGERISEKFARRLHGNNRSDQDRSCQPEVAGRLQRDEGHG